MSPVGAALRSVDLTRISRDKCRRSSPHTLRMSAATFSPLTRVGLAPLPSPRENLHRRARVSQRGVASRRPSGTGYSGDHRRDHLVRPLDQCCTTNAALRKSAGTLAGPGRRWLRCTSSTMPRHRLVSAPCPRRPVFAETAHVFPADSTNLLPSIAILGYIGRSILNALLVSVPPTSSFAHMVCGVGFQT